MGPLRLVWQVRLTAMEDLQLVFDCDNANVRAGLSSNERVTPVIFDAVSSLPVTVLFSDELLGKPSLTELTLRDGWTTACWMYGHDSRSC